MNNELITKICKFAMISSIIGVCTLGICPAFAMMGIVVGIVLKYKGIQLEDKEKKYIRVGNILGAISLVLFVVDIVLALKFLT